MKFGLPADGLFWKVKVNLEVHLPTYCHPVAHSDEQLLWCERRYQRRYVQVTHVANGLTDEQILYIDVKFCIVSDLSKES